MPSIDVSSTAQPGDLPTGRYNRAGGDVEVRVDRNPAGVVRVRATWRRLWLRLAWVAPLVLIEVGILYALWVAVPAARPVVVFAAVVAVAVHGWLGARQVASVVRPLLLVDEDGARGPVLGRDLAWDEVVEVRRAEQPRGPRLTYLGADGDALASLEPDDLPTEFLLNLLVPAGAAVALGDPTMDPSEVAVDDGRLRVRSARGRTMTATLDRVLALDVAAEPAGHGRLARRLEILAAVDAPVAAGFAEELVLVPETLARRSGVVSGLASALDPALPEQLATAGEGRTELWHRAG